MSGDIYIYTPNFQLYDHKFEADRGAFATQTVFDSELETLKLGPQVVDKRERLAAQYEKKYAKKTVELKTQLQTVNNSLTTERDPKKIQDLVRQKQVLEKKMKAMEELMNKKIDRNVQEPRQQIAGNNGVIQLMNAPFVSGGAQTNLPNIVASLDQTVPEKYRKESATAFSDYYGKWTGESVKKAG